MATPFSDTAPVSPSVSRRHARRMRRVRDQRVVLGIVVASAALAALAPAAPTGTRLFDAAWCAALGAAASWAGSRSRRWAWLWCSGLVAAGSVGSWWMVVAIAALGLALTGAFFESRARVLGAVVGGLAVQSALRMPSQGFFGLPSLIAIVALVPLFASAYERSPNRIRTRVRRLVLTVVALVFLASAGLALAAALGRSELNRAVDSSRAGLEMIRTGRQTQAATALDAASLDFGQAHNVLGAFWTWPARLVPVVAQHRDALVSASASGGVIARTGSVAAQTAPYQELKAANGTVDLTVVRSMQTPVADTAAALLAAQRTLRATRSQWLLQPVADPLSSFATQVDQALPEAILARDALADAPALLGADQDRHYLILFTNPAESRFLGGFTGSYGVLVAHDGKVSFTVGKRISQLFPDKSKTLHLPAEPDYLTRYDQYDPARQPAEPDRVAGHAYRCRGHAVAVPPVLRLEPRRRLRGRPVRARRAVEADRAGLGQGVGRAADRGQRGPLPDPRSVPDLRELARRSQGRAVRGRQGDLQGAHLTPPAGSPRRRQRARPGRRPEATAVLSLRSGSAPTVRARGHLGCLPPGPQLGLPVVALGQRQRQQDRLVPGPVRSPTTRRTTRRTATSWPPSRCACGTSRRRAVSPRT